MLNLVSSDGKELSWVSASQPGSSHIFNECQQLPAQADFKLLSFLSVGTKQQSNKQLGRLQPKILPAETQGSRRVSASPLLIFERLVIDWSICEAPELCGAPGLRSFAQHEALGVSVCGATGRLQMHRPRRSWSGASTFRARNVRAGLPTCK